MDVQFSCASPAAGRSANAARRFYIIPRPPVA